MRLIWRWVMVAMVLGTGSTALAELAVVSSGPTLHLVRVGVGTITHLSSATIPTAGLLPIHQIFSVVEHPKNGRLYASSNNPCYDGDIGCWGNGRIDRFRVHGETITYDGLAYNMNNAAFLADGISCAEGDETFTGYPGQEGECAPTNMVFSADGSRLYVDDDEIDGLEIFAVNAVTGDLTFVAEGATTDYHGLAYRNDRVYQGSSVISVAGDNPTDITTAGRGSHTEILPDGTLLSTINNSGIAAFSIADPNAPVSMASLNTGNNSAIVAGRTRDAGLFVLGGRNRLTSVSWNGTAFNQLDVETTPTNGRAHRGVTVLEFAGRTYALVAHFTPEDDVDYGNNPTGAQLWEVDRASGNLTLADDLFLNNGWSRVALALSPPQAVSAPALASIPLVVLAALLALQTARRLRRV